MTAPSSLAAARAALDDGTLSAVGLLEELLVVLAAREPEVQAITTLTADLAREQATRADARIAAGDRGPLLGIPVVVKDLVDVAGVLTTAGSKVLATNVASTSATVWARLEAAGAVLVGKANTHEFAYGGTTAPTRNPSDTSRIVGGSSGGSAAALAAGYCLGAIGTDTAGSIRIPANLCGVAGLKPTRGLIPSDGVVPLSGTLDVLGPMARTVADLEPLLRVMADLPVRPSDEQSGGPGLRVGVVRDTGPLTDGAATALDLAAAALSSLGARLSDVRIDDFAATVFDNFAVISREATVIHEQWADRRDLYTDYVRDRLEAAAQVTGAAYDAALQAGARTGDEIDRLFAAYDVLLVPGVPFPASLAYDEQVLIAGEWEDRDTALCRNLAFANLTGHPALAVPAGLEDGLPVGVQLVGPRGGDLQLLALGVRLESALPAGLPEHLR